MGLALSTRFQKICDNYNCMDLNKKFLYYFGLWPATDIKVGITQRYIIKSIPYFAFASQALASCVVIPVGIYLDPTNFALICEGASGIIFGSIFVAKGGCFWIRNASYQHLVRGLEDLVERHGNSAHAQQIKQRTHRAGVKVTSFFIAFTSTYVTMFAFGIPALLKKRELFFSGWLPSRETPYFELQLAFWVFSTQIMFMIMGAVDSFLMTFLIHLAGQMKLLRHNLSNIRPNTAEVAEEKSKGRRSGMTEETIEMVSLHGREQDSRVVNIHPSPVYLTLETSQSNLQPVVQGSSPSILIEDGNGSGEETTFIEFIENVNSMECEAHFQRIMSVDMNSDEEVDSGMVQCSDGEMTEHNIEMNLQREDERVMEGRMAGCVKHHADIISLVKDFEAAFNVILMDQFACNLLGICLAVIFTSFLPRLDLKSLGYLSFVGFLLAELYIICLLSNAVTEESSLVREAVYGCDWFEASSSFKRSMRTMMSMANQPVVIRVAGFIPLSVETFFNITHLTYSYYMTINTTLKKRGHVTRGK